MATIHCETHRAIHPVLLVSTVTLLSLTNPPNWFCLHHHAPPAHSPGHSHRDLLKRKMSQITLHLTPFNGCLLFLGDSWTSIPKTALHSWVLSPLSLSKPALPQPLLKILPHSQLLSPRWPSIVQHDRPPPPNHHGWLDHECSPNSTGANLKDSQWPTEWNQRLKWREKDGSIRMSHSGIWSKEFHEPGQKLKGYHKVQPGLRQAKATCNLTPGENKCHKVSDASQQRQKEWSKRTERSRDAMKDRSCGPRERWAFLDLGHFGSWRLLTPAPGGQLCLILAQVDPEIPFFIVTPGESLPLDSSLLEPAWGTSAPRIHSIQADSYWTGWQALALWLRPLHTGLTHARYGSVGEEMSEWNLHPKQWLKRHLEFVFSFI